MVAGVLKDFHARSHAGFKGRVHALNQHTVGQNNRVIFTIAGVQLVDGRTQTARLFQGFGVQVGDHVGARVAEPAHLNEPGDPDSLVEGDRAFHEQLIVGRDRLIHWAFKLRICRVAHIQVVFGQQELRPVVARSGGRNE